MKGLSAMGSPLRYLLRCGIMISAMQLLPISASQAQTAADFYKGKNVDLLIGYSVGGGYDVYARLIARHMGKHIPGNPTVVPKNMEGAGSLRLANWLYNVAPKDGTGLRHHRPRHRLRSAARPQAGAVRRQQVQLDRQRQRRGQRLRLLEQAWRHHQVRRSLHQGADGRRHRRRRRHRPVPAQSSTTCSAPR